MRLSIIIPVYNEAATIGRLLRHLRSEGGAETEIFVCDGGSADNTATIATAEGATVLACPEKGRAAQMNWGARQASGDVLYFVHADTIPPAGFPDDIRMALTEGFDMGRYRTRFESGKRLLRFNEWFTRFDLFICMGGDQTLFIRRSLFDELGGFRAEMKIMEEYEFCVRARAKARYKIFKKAALVSARKYEKNSWLRVQLANNAVVQRYKHGATQEELVAEYRRRLRW